MKGAPAYNHITILQKWHETFTNCDYKNDLITQYYKDCFKKKCKKTGPVVYLNGAALFTTTMSQHRPLAPLPCLLSISTCCLLIALFPPFSFFLYFIFICPKLPQLHDSFLIYSFYPSFPVSTGRAQWNSWHFFCDVSVNLSCLSRLKRSRVFGGVSVFWVISWFVSEPDLCPNCSVCMHDTNTENYAYSQTSQVPIDQLT